MDLGRVDIIQPITYTFVKYNKNELLKNGRGDKDIKKCLHFFIIIKIGFTNIHLLCQRICSQNTEVLQHNNPTKMSLTGKRYAQAQKKIHEWLLKPTRRCSTTSVIRQMQNKTTRDTISALVGWL